MYLHSIKLNRLDATTNTARLNNFNNHEPISITFCTQH